MARTTTRTATDARDLVADRRMLLTVSAVVGSTYAITAAMQTAYIYSQVLQALDEVPVMVRVGVNLGAIGVMIAFLVLWRQAHRTRVVPLVVGVVLGSVLTAVARLAAQMAFGVHPDPDRGTVVAELAGGMVAGLVAAGLGTWAMVWGRAVRRDSRAARRAAERQALAVRALETEEVRVRRAVAEGLHGSVQHRLVALVAGLDETLARLASGTVDDGDVAALRSTRDELDRLREQDVRETSRMLYPEQIEVGLLPAVRALLRRVPSVIATRLEVGDDVRAADDPVEPVLTLPERLLAVRVVEEGIANALRHGQPRSIVVRLALAGDRLEVAVRDDGGGLGLQVGPASGTQRLAQRLAVAGGELTLTGEPGGVLLDARVIVAGLAP